jgi:hypothetical protein
MVTSNNWADNHFKISYCKDCGKVSGIGIYKPFCNSCKNNQYIQNKCQKCGFEWVTEKPVKRCRKCARTLNYKGVKK